MSFLKWMATLLTMFALMVIVIALAMRTTTISAFASEQLSVETLAGTPGHIPKVSTASVLTDDQAATLATSAQTVTTGVQRESSMVSIAVQAAAAGLAIVILLAGALLISATRRSSRNDGDHVHQAGTT